MSCNVTFSETNLEATISCRDLGNLMVGECIVSVCSNCKSMFRVYRPIAASDLFAEVSTPNFCPACGARIVDRDTKGDV